MSKQNITIITDGGCLKSGGPGGWSYIVRYGDGNETRSYGAHFPTTTNEMELFAVLAALNKTLPKANIQIISDSSYVTKGIMLYLPNWIKNGWCTSQGKEVKNIHIWKPIYEKLKERTVRAMWIRGHQGHPDNEWCDQAASCAMAFLVQKHPECHEKLSEKSIIKYMNEPVTPSYGGTKPPDFIVGI